MHRGWPTQGHLTGLRSNTFGLCALMNCTFHYARLAKTPAKLFKKFWADILRPIRPVTICGFRVLISSSFSSLVTFPLPFPPSYLAARVPCVGRCPLAHSTPLPSRTQLLLDRDHRVYYPLKRRKWGACNVGKMWRRDSSPLTFYAVRFTQLPWYALRWQIFSSSFQEEAPSP